jgi:hypothetical protein
VSTFPGNSQLTSPSPTATKARISPNSTSDRRLSIVLCKVVAATWSQRRWRKPPPPQLNYTGAPCPCYASGTVPGTTSAISMPS